MNSTVNTIPVVRDVSGPIVRVDAINRELALRAEGGVIDFDIPPGCAIVLNGELVRLRLLQPLDPVHVSFEERAGRRVACTILVTRPRG